MVSGIPASRIQAIYNNTIGAAITGTARRVALWGNAATEQITQAEHEAVANSTLDNFDTTGFGSNTGIEDATHETDITGTIPDTTGPGSYLVRVPAGDTVFTSAAAATSVTKDVVIGLTGSAMTSTTPLLAYWDIASPQAPNGQNYTVQWAQNVGDANVNYALFRLFGFDAVP